ncbi:MAG: hypothetical protein OXG25_01535 [Gammaproteobacteria bacterium]|nr:hypothetical protein [Gammaproteobacteria bacterium]
MLALQHGKEADYLSLYLLERAGIGIDQVLPFWRHMPGNETFSATHFDIEDRVPNIEATIAEIPAKLQSRLPLVPNQEIEPVNVAERTLNFNIHTSLDRSY